jgi:phenylpropionate dioxygenase-like ring-hydroxylating dioxygenase large terminal subunit
MIKTGGEIVYLRNCWYVLAWSHEVTDKPLARKVLGEPVVAYRMASGGIAALEDRCPHRFIPLSMGQCSGDHLRCGYHGLTFDRTGQCVEVPSQTFIPRGTRVKAYTAAEKFGWIWIWMGDAPADPAMIPDFHQLTDARYRAVGKTTHVRASYKLLIDNLMDLSHVGFVHTSTIGNAGMGAKGKLTTRRSREGVKVQRVVPDVEPPPTYIKTGELPPGKNIDRWQVIDYTAPCFVMIHVGGAEAGTGVLEGRYEHGLNIWVLNAITPETTTTSNYFWASVRKHALANAAVDELFLSQIGEAFEEDRRILEAQQAANPNADSDVWPVGLKADEGSIEARRALAKAIERECGAAQPANLTVLA